MFYQPLKIKTVNHCEYLLRLMLYFAAPAIKPRCLVIKVFALKRFHWSRHYTRSTLPLFWLSKVSGAVEMVSIPNFVMFGRKETFHPTHCWLVYNRTVELTVRSQNSCIQITMITASICDKVYMAVSLKKHRV